MKRAKSIRRILLGALMAAATHAAAFFIPTDPYPPKTVYEYYNTGTRHYLLLSDVFEISAVDRGSAGPGWVRTGYSFAARNETLAAPNVCRFYSPSSNSHFFTADSAECAYLRSHDTGWNFEKLDFSIDVPAGGACAAGLVPVYRMYNNRWMYGDSNHRFSADPLVRDAKVAAGWADEGVAFCALSASRQYEKGADIGFGIVRPAADCENEAINVGSCVAASQLAPLANEIASWLPPSYVTKGPQYSERFTGLTGFDGDVHTGQPPADTDAVAAHSFAQTLVIASGIIGVHVSSLDRTAGDIASISPFYQFLTSPGGPYVPPPPTPPPDQRVFPWPGTRDSDLIVSFTLDVRRVVRAGPDGQGYGSAVILFRDAVSGHAFYVTLQAYGSTVPGDFTGIDTATGRVIVSTVFRPDPAFGTRIQGDYLRCAADPWSGACERSGPQAYGFRINRAQFGQALARARSLDAALSGDPADYVLANVHFRNEVYRAAEIGMSMRSFSLRIYPAY